MKLSHILNESDKATTLKAKLVKLRADLKDMSVTPHSQDAADAIDSVKDEIKDVEAALASLKEASGYDANKAYMDRYTEVQTLLGKVNRLLQDHSRTQQQNSESWGHAGDLSHVSEKLQEIIEFMAGGDNEAV